MLNIVFDIISSVTIKVVSRGFDVPGGVYEYAPGWSFVSGSQCRDYDWLVCYDELPENIRLVCPRSHTILATCEPISIKCYSQAYTGQFGHLLTNRPEAVSPHPHYHLGRGYYKWFCDKTMDEARQPIGEKSKVISAVCSSKRMRHTKHQARYDLVSAMEREIPGFAWYGHGIRAFGKKYEVMDPYKYHVVVENHIAPHHWTEKLSDAFVCECLPFYAGDPAIAECFPEESLIPIPIDDPATAVRIVKSAIDNGEYEKRREAVLEAKRRVLTRYNFWQQVIDVIGKADADDGGGESGAILFGRRVLRRRKISAALEEGWFRFRQGIGVL